MRRMGVAVLVLVAFSACRGAPAGRGRGHESKLEVSLIFVDPDHRLEACQREFGSWLLQNPDGVLFWSRDSRLVIAAPRREGRTQYHAHLYHRVGGVLVDWVAHQSTDGRIEIPLDRFDQPEALVVSSAARRYSPPEPARKEGPPAAIAPPYSLSYKLVPAELAETLLPLQRHRYEIQTPVGTLFFLVSSFNRGDQLLTWVDPARKLSALIGEDPYVHLRAHDSVIVPRVRVDVVDAKTGALWQRSGTWPLPAALGRPGGRTEDKPFVLRTPRRELISFGPAATLDLELPQDPPGTSAPVEARFRGVGREDALTFALAVAYPAGPKGEYSFRIETDTITAERPSRSYACSLDHLDSSSFPLLSAITHRLRTPWVLTGGRYAPVPPRGSDAVPLDRQDPPAGLHARIVTPRHASHFDLVEFLGQAGARKRGNGVLADSFRVPGPDDPNLIPPPPGGPPGGDFVPPPPPGPSGGRDPGGLSPPGVGGGDDSTCGCGPDGRNCPDATAPCRGRCGKACPGNGHCKPKAQAGVFKVVLPCPPKGKSCGQSEENCKCPPHPWDFTQVLGALQAWFIPQGAADVDWHGIHGATAPCHQWTHVADAVVRQWVGVQQVAKVFQVYVTFKPCIELAGLVWREPDDPEHEYDYTTLELDGEPNPISTGVYNDPNTSVETQALVETFSEVPGTLTFECESTNSVPTAMLTLDSDSLAAIATALEENAGAFSTAYWERPESAPPAATLGVGSLPVESWGTYRPGTPSSGGGTVSGPGGGGGGGTGGGGSGGGTGPGCDPTDYYTCPPPRSR